MSDTPETDAAWAEWQYAGPGVHANFARKIERERDEARKERDEANDKLRILSYPAVIAVLGKMSNSGHEDAMNAMRENLKVVDRIAKERDELRQWKEEQMLIESEWDAQEIARMLGGALGQSCHKVIMNEVPRIIAERDALRAEVNQLKAERDNWRVSSVCRELNAELERLKADKARMDWLAALDCDSPLWDALSDTTKLRSTIDAAMKGEL